MGLFDWLNFGKKRQLREAAQALQIRQGTAQLQLDMERQALNSFALDLFRRCFDVDSHPILSLGSFWQIRQGRHRQILSVWATCSAAPRLHSFAQSRDFLIDSAMLRS